jgi:4-carboxymuconolactone decarboxylase
MLHGRLHWYTPDELDADQRAYYDELLSGPRDPRGLIDEEGRLTGAFNARVLDRRSAR